MLSWLAAMAVSMAGTAHVDFVANKDNVRFCVAASEALVTWQRGLGNSASETESYVEIGKFFLTGLEPGDAKLASLRTSIARDAAWGDRYEICRTIFNSADGGTSLSAAAETADLFAPEADSSDDSTATVEDATEEAAETSAPVDQAAAFAEMEAENAAMAAKSADRQARGTAALAKLSPQRRREVRCAMLATMVMLDDERGAPTKSYGLTKAKAATLGGRLTETIVRETGLPAADVDAAFHQDFEEFTFAMLGNGQSEAVAQKTLDQAMEECQPVFAAV